MAHKITIEDIKKISHLEFLAKKMVEGFITGLHKSPYHGFSVEFAEHRLYNTGDSTRHIDWKVFARTDKLFTKRYDEETNLRCQILIDISPSMFYPTENRGKITFSAMAAAGLAWLLQTQRDAVGLTLFSDEIKYISPVKSKTSHTHTLIQKLQEIIDQKISPENTKISDTLHQIAEKMGKRSLIVIFSDLLNRPEDEEAFFTGLQHLKHNKHEVLLFNVLDKNTEIEFNFEDKPYLFTDIETGEKIKIQPQQIKKEVEAQMNQYLQKIKLKCHQYKIDFIEADISLGFEQILAAYLIKRAKMR